MFEYFKIYNSLKNNFGFFVYHFFFFQLLKIDPPGQGEVRQGSRKIASGVNDKCAGGKGEVRHGSRRSASGVKDKCFL